MTVDWNVIITATLVILGWFVANRLTARRELKNKKREVRIGYMIEAYRKIASAANRGPTTSDEQKAAIESAVEDIQLLGNTHQMAALNRMIESGENDFMEVLRSLRQELRNELNLDDISAPLKFYRMARGEQGADGNRPRATHSQSKH